MTRYLEILKKEFLNLLDSIMLLGTNFTPRLSGGPV